MDTGAALVAAIVAEPDDDALRLIYADWLQDHGQESRAEFIRLELAMHARRVHGLAPEPWGDPEYDRLEARWEELVRVHSTCAWFPELVRLALRYHTSRGFVESVTTTGGRFADQADAIHAAAPLLRTLTLEDLGEHAPASAARPELAGLTGLEIDDVVLEYGDLHALCMSSHLAGLRELRLGRSQLDPQEFGPLARLEALTALELSGNTLGDESQSLFAYGLPHLRELWLQGCGVGDATARAILLRTAPERLRTLNLNLNDLTAVGADHLAAAPHLASLEVLELSSNPLGAGLAALARSPYLRSLRKLAVGYADIREAEDAALAELLRSPVLARVEELDLGWNWFGRASLSALAESETLAAVRSFTFSMSHSEATALAGLARARLPALRRLDLSHMAVWGQEAFFAAPLLGRLHQLDLNDCLLKDADVALLAGSETLANLRGLSLRKNRIGDAGAMALAQSPYLGNLIRLNLARNPVGESGRAALVERFGPRACQFGSGA